MEARIVKTLEDVRAVSQDEVMAVQSIWKSTIEAYCPLCGSRLRVYHNMHGNIPMWSAGECSCEMAQTIKAHNEECRRLCQGND